MVLEKCKLRRTDLAYHGRPTFIRNIRRFVWTLDIQTNLFKKKLTTVSQKSFMNNDGFFDYMVQSEAVNRSVDVAG